MKQTILNGILIDEQTELSVDELSRMCSSSIEYIIELVEEGVLEPVTDHVPSQWRFPASSLQRARTASRLQHDLEINLAGVALALDLLDEIETLEARLHRGERSDNH
ncbi:MAG: chaperone modulator CbpM [Gammaproteobacteria bacterium]|nr:chaperone modulator CbpM [Gammaproteobacteria bacterium]